MLAGNVVGTISSAICKQTQSMRDTELHWSIFEWNGYGTSELCALFKVTHRATIPLRRIWKQQQNSLSIVRATALATPYSHESTQRIHIWAVHEINVADNVKLSTNTILNIRRHIVIGYRIARFRSGTYTVLVMYHLRRRYKHTPTFRRNDDKI